MLLTNIAEAGGNGLEGYGVPSNMEFYGGGSIGSASQDASCTLDNSKSCSDKDTGYKVFAGARLTPDTEPGSLPTLGVEGGYINFGKSSSSGDLLSTRGNDIGDTSANSDVTGLYAAGVAFMPVAPQTEVFAKAGVIRWNQDNKYAQSETEDPESDLNYSQSSSRSGFGGIAGVGAQYKVTDNVAVRGEYEQGFSIGKDKNKTNPSLLSVGAVFSSL